MTTILIEKNVMVPMRDGARLAANIYRLDSAGPQPVLLARTPYDKENMVNGDDVFNWLKMVQAGYIVMIQDVRGRFASEGDYEGMLQERADGADTIAWAASQPWSSGAVGTFSGSYLGITQWLAALEHPEALRATAPWVTWSDLYEGMLYSGGAFLMHGLVWPAAMSVEANRRQLEDGRLSPEESGAANAAIGDMQTLLSHLPLVDHPYLRKLAPFYFDWLDHPMPGETWQPVSPGAGYAQITAPALNMGGWYDCFLQGTLNNYIGLRREGGSENARKYTRLVIGPWGHGLISGVFPEHEYGPSASALACDLHGLNWRWYDHWLKGIDNGVEREKPVKIFVMGLNQWREEEDWPLPDAVERHYYLRSDGAANTLDGDGALSLDPPAQEPADVYLYNPHRPVPTHGGQVLIVVPNDIGPRDQRSVEARDDVLVYSTPPLEKAVEITGPISLCLFVASSARDTDFTGKLVDVFPNGQAINLTDGILRARYHHSLSDPRLLEPGEIYELRIDLWATSNLFLPGHRIRLEVSSSNFPKYARNTNTGGEIACEGLEACVPALNRVFHDREHPSHLILPVIERA